MAACETPDRAHEHPYETAATAQTLAGTTNGCPVLAGEHGVGLGVVDERLGRGVDVQLAAEPVGDVAQVAVGAGEVPLLDVGVEELAVAGPDGLDEVGEVVAAAGAAGPLLQLVAEVDLPVAGSW